MKTVGHMRAGWRPARWAIAAALVCALFTAPSPGAKEPEKEVKRDFTSEPGETKILPNSLNLINGGTSPVAEESKVIILHFVDCKSGLCEESLKAIDTYMRPQLEGKPVTLLGIAVGSTLEDAKDLTERLKLHFQVLADTDGVVFHRIAADGVPRTVILSKKGEVLYQHAGYRPGRDAEYLFVVDQVLAGAPIPGNLAPSAGAPPSKGEGFNEDLYAKDIRGQQAPEVPVEMWINPAPEAKGKFLLVDFWATWCGPCVQSLSVAERLHGKFEEHLVSMAISDEDPDTVKRFVQMRSIKQPIGIDTKARAKNALQVRGIPLAFIANPDGKVVWEGHPMELWSNNGALLQEILDGKEFIPKKKE